MKRYLDDVRRDVSPFLPSGKAARRTAEPADLTPTWPRTPFLSDVSLKTWDEPLGDERRPPDCE